MPGLWIERHFAQAIIHEDQTAVGDSEFGNPNRLRSEVKSDQACRSGHGVKGLNRNSKMLKQNFYSEMQPDGMRCPQRVGHMTCRLISCALANGIRVFTCTLSPDLPLHAYLENG